MRVIQRLWVAVLGLAAVGCGMPEESVHPELGQVESALTQTALFRAEGNTNDSYGVLPAGTWLNPNSTVVPTYTDTGVTGKAFHIDWDKGYVEVPHNSLLAGSSFSVQARFLPINFATWHAIVNKRGDSGEEYSIWLSPGQNQHTLKAFVSNEAGVSVGFQSSILVPWSNPGWHTVKLSYDAATGMASLWHNGQFQGSQALAGPRRLNTAPLRIGAQGGGADRFWGLIDEVQFESTGRVVSLNNSSFESGLNYWGKYRNEGSNATHGTSTTGPVPDNQAGSRYAYITATSGGDWATLAQNLPGTISGGQRYQVKAWMRTNVSGSLAELQLRDTVNKTAFLIVSQYALTSSWQLYTYEMTVPTGFSGTGELIIRLRGNGNVQVDGVKVTQL